MYPVLIVYATHGTRHAMPSSVPLMSLLSMSQRASVDYDGIESINHEHPPSLHEQCQEIPRAHVTLVTFKKLMRYNTRFGNSFLDYRQ